MHKKTLLKFINASSFYRELHKIFMDDHSEITIVVQNLIFYNNNFYLSKNYSLFLKIVLENNEQTIFIFNLFVIINYFIFLIENQHIENQALDR